MEKKKIVKKKVAKPTKTTTKANKEDIKKKLLIILEKNFHNISDACRKVHINRSTFFDWIKEDADFKKASDDIKEKMFDDVEKVIYELATDTMDMDAIKLIIKYKGFDRGWKDKVETDVNIKSIGDIKINIIMPDDKKELE